MTVLALGALALLISLVAGLRAGIPSDVHLELMAGPRRRPAIVALYMVGGFDRFVPQAAEWFTRHSLRYRARPFDLGALWLLIVMTFGLAVIALNLGWLIGDVATLGGWSFFLADAPLAMRLWQGGAVISVALFGLYVLGDWDAIEVALLRRFGAFGLALRNVGLVLVLALPLKITGNHGLALLLLPIVPTRLIGGWGLALAVVLIAYKDAPSMGPTLTSLWVYVAVSGVFAWIVLRLTVELWATAWWYQSSGKAVLLGIGALSLLAATAAIVATPLVAGALLTGLEGHGPQTITEGLGARVAEIRAAGQPTLWVLVLGAAAPLVPVLGIAIYGAGSAIGNLLAPTRAFVAALRAAEPEGLSPAGLKAALRLLRAGYVRGYALATAAALVLGAGALWLAQAVLLRLIWAPAA